MNITVEKLDEINFMLKGTIEDSAVKEKVEKLKEEAKKEAKDENVTDEQIEQVAAGEVFKEIIAEGIKQANIPEDTLLGQPALKRYEKQNDKIHFEAELAVSPEINLDAIDLDAIVPSYTKPTADPKKVEEKLVDFANKQSPFKPIPEPKAVENGDVVVIDFTGYIDDKEFEGGKATKFNLKIGSNSFIGGFEDQLIGMEYGDERTISVTFPTEYQAKDLAGKDAQFVVTLHEIQEQKAENIDDEFAKKILNDDTATLEMLKEKLATQVTTQELSDLYINELKPKILEGLLSQVDFILPNNIVEQEIDAKVRELLQAMPAEQQKENMENKDKFLQMREMVRKAAENSIKAALIVEALAKKEGVSVDENETISALTYQAMMAGQDASELVEYYRKNNLMTSVTLALIEDKLFGQLLGFDK